MNRNQTLSKARDRGSLRTKEEEKGKDIFNAYLYNTFKQSNSNQGLNKNDKMIQKRNIPLQKLRNL